LLPRPIWHSPHNRSRAPAPAPNPDRTNALQRSADTAVHVVVPTLAKQQQPARIGPFNRSTCANRTAEGHQGALASLAPAHCAMMGEAAVATGYEGVGL
jgi:hypothetical protein